MLKLCEKCNKIVTNTRGYCFFCGNKFNDFELNKCPECGANISDTVACKYCGFEIKRVSDPSYNKTADEIIDSEIIKMANGNRIIFGRYPQKLYKTTSIYDVPENDKNSLKKDVCMFCKDYVYYMSGSTVKWYQYDPIEWIILEKDKNGNALIMSQNILQGYQFANNSSNSYEVSDVRNGLNDFFYKNAFNDIEREYIINTKVDNSAKTTMNKSNPFECNDTYDNIFVLSYQEVLKYFKSAGARQARHTDYCGYDTWHTRSPHHIARYKSSIYVTADGEFRDGTGYCGCRPALWIKLPK